MDIKPGTRVKVVDEDLAGVVLRQEGNRIIISCTDGFEYDYSIHDLIFLDESGGAVHSPVKVKIELNKEKTSQAQVVEEPHFTISFTGKKPSFDLHIDDLAPRKKFGNKHEILEFQLNFCCRVIEKAMQAKIRRMVFIHGLGSGKLRKELRQMLHDQYPFIEYFDASYQEFGPGATEIEIHGLGKR